MATSFSDAGTFQGLADGATYEMECEEDEEVLAKEVPRSLKPTGGAEGVPMPWNGAPVVVVVVVVMVAELVREKLFCWPKLGGAACFSFFFWGSFKRTTRGIFCFHCFFIPCILSRVPSLKCCFPTADL